MFKINTSNILLKMIIIIVFIFFGSIQNVFATNILHQIRARNFFTLYKQNIQKYHTISPGQKQSCVSLDKVNIRVYMYHYIRPSHRDQKGGITWNNSITPGNFEKQIQYLYNMQKNKKTEVALFSELENWEKYNCFPNENITILSFDDGRWDNHEYAFPIMKKYGIKANFGIIVNRIGFHGKRIDPFMTYEEIKEISDHLLFEIQSHSVSHRNLRSMNYSSQQKELCESKRYLEKLFHTHINTFIVPGGYHTSSTNQLAKTCGYTYTFITKYGTIQASKLLHTPYQLPRIRVQRNMSGEELFGK